MTRDQFLAQLEDNNICLNSFSLNSGKSERYVLEQDTDDWMVFYFERVLKRYLRDYLTEAEALRDLLSRLLEDKTARRR